ncbi:hypothetical protein LLH00_14560 [bacterium]|nr:hypothetical protein [bacterium]
MAKKMKSPSEQFSKGWEMRIAACGVLLMIILSIACSEDSLPFGPESLAESELVYFPLQKGYKAQYSYYYKYLQVSYWEDSYGLARCFRKDGMLNLEVIDTHVKESEKEIFYKIRTAFSLQADYYFINPEDTIWQSVPDSITIKEYDLMLKNGSLWYVENAPSFEQLDAGDTTLMMASPIGCGGKMYLRLFPFSTEDGFYSTGVYGDTCKYGSNSETYAAMLKNKGILNVVFRQTSGGIHFDEEHVVRCDLIE